MGIGPAPVIERVLARSGVELADIGVIELNEAFAAQAIAVMMELGIDDEDPKVNGHRFPTVRARSPPARRRPPTGRSGRLPKR